MTNESDDERDDDLTLEVDPVALVGLMNRLFGKVMPRVEIADPVTKAPDMHGAAGKAWVCDHRGHTEEKLARWGVMFPDDSPEKIAREWAAHPVIAQWCLEIPGAHPAWHSYEVSLMTLDWSGLSEKPIIYLEGATHEFVVSALSPDGDRNKMIDGELSAAGTWGVLTPRNFACQIVCASDDEAKLIIHGTVRDVVDGKLNPDTDGVGQWIARFNASMLTKGDGEAYAAADECQCPSCVARRAGTLYVDPQSEGSVN